MAYPQKTERIIRKWIEMEHHGIFNKVEWQKKKAAGTPWLDALAVVDPEARKQWEDNHEAIIKKYGNQIYSRR